MNGLNKSIFVLASLLLTVTVILAGCSGNAEGPYNEENGWTVEERYMYKTLDIPAEGKTGFTSLNPEETGIEFKNILKDQQSAENQIRNNGSGVALGDVDNDGLTDIYFARLDGPNVLYKNIGHWKFKEITSEAGAEIALPNQFSTGAVFSDVDGDRDLDLIVSGLGSGTKLFLNDGSGEFKEITESSGLKSSYGSYALALADIEGDGDLDLYASNYRTTTLRDYGGEITLQMVDGKLTVPEKLKDRIIIKDGALKEYGEPDFLYLNDGKGNFKALSWTDGTFLDEDGKSLTGPPLDWGLSVTFRDMDRDGDPDIYVCNDFWSPERIWINDGEGRFRAIDNLAIRKTSATSMGVDFSDIDRDGDYDFFVVDMLSRHHKLRKMQMGTMKPTPVSIGEIENRPQIMRNTLYLNRGDNTYAEIAELGGLEGSEWSWSPVFLDIDLDGYEDVFITNGNVRDVQDSDTLNHIRSLNLKDAEAQRQTLLLYPRLESENLVYRNNGDLTFEEVGAEWGLGAKGISHGAALADFDNDGDLDMVLNNLGIPAGVYRNDSVAPRISVRLKGLTPNTQGIGAQVKFSGGPVEQSQEVISGGRYLSGSDPVLTFAAGDSIGNMTIEVTWRSGKKSIVNDVKPNRIYVLDEKFAKIEPETEPEVIEPLFEDVSERISHMHHEDEFDDFALQPLLPNRLSQLGPGAAWHDLNHDGNEDLLISSGSGGKLAVYINDGQGGFTNLDYEHDKTKLDQTSVLAWSKDSKSSSILVGLSNFEDHKNPAPSALKYDFGQGALSLEQSLPALESSTGVAVLADIDGDGDLDLFIGGRTIPSRYPEPASSAIYKNSNGNFNLDEVNSTVLSDIGMISGAVFSDLDRDGYPDLVLAPEWGAVRVLKNENGNFKDSTDELCLSEHEGWWNGVTTADLDSDGRLDIVATNWGRNHKYHFDREHPLYVYFDDFDKDGTLDIVEAHYDYGMEEIVPERGLSCSSDAMPFIKTKLPTFEEFGSAGIVDIYGELAGNSGELTANNLDHTVFFNKEGCFEAVSLPVEAQLAPSFGVNAEDFDGDGNEDLFITQNFFASQIETPRIDAGRGLLLKGDGKGGLEPVPGQLSGIHVYGDSRGSATGDFDNDGRVDLLVTQNGAESKLYRNLKAEPGLRVRLNGPKHNPDGIGSQIRLVYTDRVGPVREVHGGSGYWSQNSVVQIMGASEEASQIEVLWPGGKKTSSDIAEDSKEILVGMDGSVLKLQ